MGTGMMRQSFGEIHKFQVDGWAQLIRYTQTWVRIVQCLKCTLLMMRKMTELQWYAQMHRQWEDVRGLDPETGQSTSWSNNPLELDALLCEGVPSHIGNSVQFVYKGMMSTKEKCWWLSEWGGDCGRMGPKGFYSFKGWWLKLKQRKD